MASIKVINSYIKKVFLGEYHGWENMIACALKVPSAVWLVFLFLYFVLVFVFVPVICICLHFLYMYLRMYLYLNLNVYLNQNECVGVCPVTCLFTPP